MNNEEGENKLSKDESKMEPSVTEEVETKVEEIEKDSSNPIPPSIGATIVSGEQIQNSHLSTSSENSDTPFLPQENNSVEDTKKEEEEIKKETIKEEKATEVPEINIVPPQIVIEIPEEDSDEKKLSNSEKLRRTLSTNTLAPKAAKKKRGSLDLKGGEEDDEEEEILERHSIDVPVQKPETPKLSIQNEIDIRPSLDFSRQPMTKPIQFEKKKSRRAGLDIPLMKYISAKPKVIHVRKRNWNEDHYAFHTFQHADRPIGSGGSGGGSGGGHGGETEEEILERRSFTAMREHDPKKYQMTQPRRRSEDGFGRNINSNRQSLLDEMPPLEDPEDSPYDPDKEEELSNIGKRIEQKKQEYERIKSKYDNRFRFDPRCYFFLHLAWILSVGFFGGLLIYLIELSYTQISFVDAVFMAFSACTVTGLFAVNFSLWSIYGKIVVFMCICKIFFVKFFFNCFFSIRNNYFNNCTFDDY